MQFLELVKRRHSLRRYSQREVSRDIIERCLEAARLAPSACNSQPWTFIVVDDRDLKNRLSDKAFSGIYSVNSFAKRAPVIIVVITERSVYAARLGSFFRGIQYNLIDIGIACEHFILQAAQEGVGSCWLGWFNEKGVKKILDLPKNKRVDILICMGYPEFRDKEIMMQMEDKKRKPLDEIRRYNK